MAVRSSRARRRLAATGLPLLLAVVSCAAPSGAVDTATESPATALARFYDQPLPFGPCGEYATTTTEEQVYAANPQLECVRMQVPLDYADPDGPSAQIAVLRVPARGERLGSLLINPGGPGGAGLLQAAISAKLLAQSPVTKRFDLIGFDPRGVGASTPAISCFTDAEMDDGPMTTLIGQEGQWTEEDTRGLVTACAAGSGGEQVLATVGTRDAARDMDVLRAALGDEQLSYLGQSYGTRLGAVYAEMFPQNVRAMVLDGAVNPKLGTVERRLTQYAGFQRSFEQLATACAAGPACPLGGDPGRAAEVFQGIVRPLIDAPVPTASGRRLTYNQATGAVIAGLYTAAQWPDILRGITEVQQGRGDTLLALGDAFGGRDATGRWTNYAEANYAINCLDEQRRTPEQETELRRQLFEAAPFLDSGTGVAGTRDGCEFWPVEPTLDYPYADAVEGLPPTLTISITGDPSTPFEAGTSLARSLGGSMLTVEGEQHTVALSGTSPCVNDVVAAYLIDLQTPAPDARCRL
ncbi:alpha/beta hydrolase [Pseudonocardia alaniniphila]|uniref:Alpha/beta hydrolase n=1 Tax=Pseudonocardia alaniniphila TaxID=75291 RepID=A0ABS9TTC1_9PSEU|nr:alpha/beta hydrolase [Pseudonocardia alaniniphila]MCH6171809.1 alpha/beta hydrolase [Pseudonocardia alaniniphila]